MRTLDPQYDTISSLGLEELLASDEAFAVGVDNDLEEIASAAARRIIEAGQKERQAAALKLPDNA